MPTIPLGLGDWESPSQNITRIKFRNMYLIDNPTSSDQVSRIGRPTVSRFAEFSEDAVKGVWQQAGSLNNVWLIVAGETLWEYDGSTFTEVDDVPGEDFAQFAATTDRVIFVRDGVAYSYDGTTLTTVTMPDSVGVSSVAAINGYFILTVEDSQRFYWTEPGETDPDALSFASAERTPDNIVCVKVVGDEVWFLGESGCEVWQTTGSSDDPFIRIPARVYDESCKNKDSVSVVTYQSSPAVMWVTSEGGVVLAQGRPQLVSNGAVEEKVRASASTVSWFFKYFRNNFYVLTGDDFTYVFDTTKGVWSRWDTYERDYWRPHLGIQDREKVYGFDSEEGVVWLLEEGELDEDSIPVIREVSGFLESFGRPQPCFSVVVFVNVGWSGEYSFTPILEMRWSDDNGTTYTNYQSVSLGEKGEYKTDLWFRSLGQIKSPGRYFEFRYSGPGPFRLDYATVNEE